MLFASTLQQTNSKMIIRVFLLIVFSYHTLYGQENLRFLSWNIQNFGQTKSHTEIEQIANIIIDYDMVAIQDVVATENMGEKSMNQLIACLAEKGSIWEYVISQPTKTRKSKRKRYVYLWKPHRVEVVGEGKLLEKLQKKLVHEAFVLQIRWQNQIVNLYNYQAKDYRKHPEKEIEALGNYLSQTKETYLLFGSFNLTTKHEVFTSFKADKSLSVIDQEKTLLYSYCRYKYYLHLSIDNSYYPTRYFTLISSGVLDYVGSCENLKTALKISNHLPVVANFSMKVNTSQEMISQN